MLDRAPGWFMDSGTGLVGLRCAEPVSACAPLLWRSCQTRAKLGESSVVCLLFVRAETCGAATSWSPCPFRLVLMMFEAQDLEQSRPGVLFGVRSAYVCSPLSQQGFMKRAIGCFCRVCGWEYNSVTISTGTVIPSPTPIRNQCTWPCWKGAVPEVLPLIWTSDSVTRGACQT